MDRIYEANIARSLASIAESAERIAVALEKLSLPGGQDREAADKVISIGLSGSSTAEDRKAMSDAIRKMLLEKVQADSLQQPLYPTEHTPSQDGELPSGEPDQKSGTPQHP